MHRDEKQLESTVQSILQRVSDIKTSIATMLFKLENEFEHLNWPMFLDNFALVTGQLNSLLKSLKSDQTSAIRNHVVLPLTLCPDRDEQLAKLTEARVTTFSHDLVPNYLRTKLDPDVEKKHQDIENRAITHTLDSIQKQINALNKVASHVLENINTARDEWDNDTGSRAQMQQTTTNIGDTHAVVAAITNGKGLKAMAGGPMGGPGGVPVRPGMPPQGPPTQPGMPPGKAPSAIKTTIKSANQMHPYGR